MPYGALPRLVAGRTCKEYVDLGHSGAKALRPALEAQKAAARKREVRQVFVSALDRLRHSLRDLLLPTTSPSPAARS